MILDQMKLFNYLAAILVPNAFGRSAGRFQAGPIDTGLFYDEYLQGKATKYRNFFFEIFIPPLFLSEILKAPI